MFGVLTAISAIIAFAVTFLSGYIIIPLMHKLKYGQTILEIGPKWHKNKQGTPTMGGIMFVIGIAISLLTTMPLINLIGPAELKTQLGEMRQIVSLVAGLALAVSMSLIGFIDDYIKVVKKQNLGLTAKQKTLMQLLVSAAQQEKQAAILTVINMIEGVSPLLKGNGRFKSRLGVQRRTLLTAGDMGIATPNAGCQQRAGHHRTFAGDGALVQRCQKACGHSICGGHVTDAGRGKTRSIAGIAQSVQNT